MFPGIYADVKKQSQRFQRIRETLLSTPVYLCPERALLITDYFKHHDNRRQPMIVRRAKALRHILENKSVKIFPDELIAGNVGSRRISALIQPELAGVIMGTELLWIDKRKTTPMKMSWPDRLQILLRVFPYWATRSMAVRAFGHRIPWLMRYVKEQLSATYYLINEAGGIGHFLPNYERMLEQGIQGYLAAIAGKEGPLYEAARIACEGVITYAGRLADEVESQAGIEPDKDRALELLEIARICRKVPEQPPQTFHEALQALWLTHMGVCLEGLNSAISFGRMDQYLHPFYRRDLEAGKIDPEKARELLLSFSAKACEHVFLLSERTSQYHGGYLVVQAASVGGMNRNGQDAVNDLTYIFLDVMEQSGLRDPNYQARIHEGSPDEYVHRALDVARQGKGVPALFHDGAAVATLAAQGYPIGEARNYAIVGCVELALPGKSFFSTDAGLFSLPLCLELALNRGRRISGGKRIGVETKSPESFASMDDVIEAFRQQVEYMSSRMIGELQIIEGGNRDYHPTPFSSMLVDGCLETGRDVTEGGALYNSSGIQGVGVADVADSFAALHHVVFMGKAYSMNEIIRALNNNFSADQVLHESLLSAPKFGNDHPLPDGYARMVAGIYYDALARHRNTRGGPYVPGFYSVTCHVAFGSRTAALPSGRKAGEPFASSLGAGNGLDCLGPTAMLKSVASIDPKMAPNGYALNLRFDPKTVEGDQGVAILTALTKGFFESGGMEMQLNVVDPKVLEDARANPGKYPGLVVRVAGYCAYFDDLPEKAKDEIIHRTRLAA
ncbi:MAG: pyruvate formate lyase family protein [Syntrophales bacterium]|jgi:formate C-acetyltransferase